MAIAAYALPFGLRQLKLTPLDAAGAPVTASAKLLPASRTFSFKEVEDFTDLTGDDRTIASHGSGPHTEWSLEGGGISAEIWAILSGATIVSSGTTPAAIKTTGKLVSQARPYFQVEGRALNDNGGDFHMVVYRCKADGDLSAEFNGGDFTLTAADGKGYGNLTDDKLYDFVHNETAVPITAP